MIGSVLSADADAVCGAEYGVVSPDRVSQRNGYRHRELDTRVSTIEPAPDARAELLAALDTALSHPVLAEPHLPAQQSQRTARSPACALRPQRRVQHDLAVGHRHGVVDEPARGHVTAPHPQRHLTGHPATSNFVCSTNFWVLGRRTRVVDRAARDRAPRRRPVPPTPATPHANTP